GNTLTLTSNTTMGGTNTGDVTLDGTPDYITISGQTITRNKLDISDDTNATGGVGITLTANDFACDTADTGTFGCLTSTDWNTFNTKLSSYDAWTHPAYGGSATTSLLTLSGGFLNTAASSTIVGNLLITGNSTTTNATTTNFFATTASSTNSYSSTYYAGNGSVSAPAFSFAGDTDTGLYVTQADVISFATGGILRATLGGNFIRVAGGVASTPAFSSTNDSNTGMYFPAADSIGFSLGGAEKIRINSSGDVGIGTTSPYAKLSVVGGTSGTALAVDTITGFSGNLLDLKVASTTKFVINQNGDFIASGNSTTTNATSTNSFATNASSTNLYSQSATLGSLTLGTPLAVTSGGTGQLSFGQGWLHSDGTTLTSSTSPTVAYLTATSTTATSTFAGGLTVDGTTLVVDYSSGNVGIGKANPGYKLEVAGGSVNTDAGQPYRSGGNWLIGQSSNIIQIGSSVVANDVRFDSTSGSGIIMIKSSGNVGIGTTTPTWLLNPTSATASQLALSAGAGVSQWAFRNAGGNLYIATTTVAGTATSSVSALSIDSNGLLTLPAYG
ncbi:MAG: hypothetical protein Q7K26_02520, partial [bacterium]|nr:hypothetical protein [bacterium]